MLQIGYFIYRLSTLNLAQQAAVQTKELRSFVVNDPGTSVLVSEYWPNAAQSQDQQTMHRLRHDIAEAIGRLHSGGAIGNQELPIFLGMLPAPGDKDKTISDKLMQLQTKFDGLSTKMDPKGVYSEQAPQQSVGMGDYEQEAKENPGLTQDQYNHLVSQQTKAVGPQAQTGIQDTRQYEGLSLTPYKDGNSVSVGYGHYMDKPTSRQQFAAVGANYDAVKSGREGLTKEQADQLYQMDAQTAADDAKQLVSNFDQQPPVIQKVLVDMAYNLGATKLAQFRPTLNAIQAGNYTAAATRLGNTKWNDQVGQRAKDIQLALRDAG